MLESYCFEGLFLFIIMSKVTSAKTPFFLRLDLFTFLCEEKSSAYFGLHIDSA